MEVPLTPEQEARLAQIASFEGLDPAQLVQDAISRLIDETEHSSRVCPNAGTDSKDTGLMESMPTGARGMRM